LTVDSLRISVISLLALNLLLVGILASQPGHQAVSTEPSASERSADISTIVLIRELDEPDKQGIGLQCFTVGPFESRRTAEAIVEMLAANVVSAHTRTTEAFVDRGYWVFLPPFKDVANARQAVRDLYEAGHEDVELIKDGEWNLSVSLGYFINQANASSLADSIRNLGFNPEMRVQRDDESRYWVDYQQQAGQQYASQVLAGFVPSTLHRALSCTGEDEAGGIAAVSG